MGELTASDVFAMTRNNNEGFLEGNGIIILILFFLIFGMGGNGFGFGGNSAWQGAMTRAEMYDGLNTKQTQDSVNALGLNMCNGFSGVNQNILKSVNDVQMGMCNGVNSINSNLQGLASQMASCCCEIKTAVHSEGEQTRALIQENTIQSLRDEINAKDRELLSTGLVTAQTIQTQNLENFIRGIVGNNYGCGC